MHKYLLQGLLSVTALLGGVLLFATPTLAADTIVGSNGDYLDTDGDGTVDVIRWTMDENVTACTYDAADWTVNTASQMNITITGLDCAGDDTILDIEVSADENETGAATAPVISYANAGTLNSITLAGGNMGPHASVTTDDLAAPVIISTTPISAGSGISLYTNLVFTFSEDMATATTYNIGGEVTISPSPGGWANGVWSSTDTVLTFDTTSLLLCNTTYTVASTEASFEDGASNVLVTTGPQDGDFTFFTGCVADDAAPANVAIELVGAACEAAEGTFTFSIEGDNIAEYLISESDRFTGSHWAAMTESGEFDHTFMSNEQTLYVVVQSRNELRSTIHELSVDEDWAELCSVPVPDEDEDEEDQDEQEEDEDTSPVTAGSYVRGASNSAVYYIDSQLKRRPFTDSQTFFTWQSSFENVITITDSELASVPMGAPMLPKAGVVLVKVQSVDKVYWLETDSSGATELRWITSEEDAISLFGADWADYVIDIPSTLFTRFEKGSNVHASENISKAMLKRRTSLR